MSESLSALYLSNPALAVALRHQQQGAQFSNEAQSTAPASPWQALARLAQAYVGGREEQRAAGDIKGIGEAQQKAVADFNAPQAPEPVPIPPQVSVSPATMGATSPVAMTGNGATIPPELLPHYEAASRATGIPVAVLAAKDRQESNFNNSLRGGAGEIGIAQVKPTTAADPGFGVAGMPPEQLADPATNIMFGARYLAGRGKAAGVQDWTNPAEVGKALAAYNGGGDPNYVANVSRYLPAGFGGAAAAPTGAPAEGFGGAPAPTGRPALVAALSSGPVPSAAAAPPTGAAGAPGATGGALRASPLADAYLGQANALMQKARQAAASPIPAIHNQAQVLIAQAQQLQKLATEKPKLTDLRPGAILVDEQGRKIAENPDNNPLNVVRGPDDAKGNPTWQYATRTAAVGQTAPTPGPMVSIDQRGLAAETQEYGKGLAEEAKLVRDQAGTAAATIDQVRQLRSVGAETDRLAPARELFGSALDALGVKGTAAVKGAATLQAFNGALSGLVLGAQLAQKGVQTEGDANRMREQYAKTTNTMEANDFLMRATEQQAARTMEKADFYERWRQEHNGTSDGALGAWNKFIREVPLTIRGPNGVVFYNEALRAAQEAGVSPDQLNAEWKARAVQK